MNQPAKAQEPSMEEILASIRRIIADDDAGRPKAEAPPKPAPAPTPPPPRPAANKQEDIDAMLADLEAPPKATPKPAPKPVAPPPVDVLDLTEAMAAPAPAPSFRTIDGASDVVFTDQPPEPPRAPPAPEAALISTATKTAVDTAFSSLANIVLGQNARTLEDLVREMLRPMLKAWLDDNLPGMVERIVRAEIERVSRGRQ
jgi:cell pole-organizing protein PopZ